MWDTVFIVTAHTALMLMAEHTDVENTLGRSSDMRILTRIPNTIKTWLTSRI